MIKSFNKSNYHWLDTSLLFYYFIIVNVKSVLSQIYSVRLNGILMIIVSVVSAHQYAAHTTKESSNQR